MSTVKSLQEQINELCKQHGIYAVKNALMVVLNRHRLAGAAAKFNLVPHTFEAVNIKGRKN